MNALQDTRRLLAQNRSQLAARYPIQRLALFGSYARNEATPDSDVDILVEFSQPVGLKFFELAQELEQLLDRHVDLVSRNGIKPAYFAAIEPDLIDV
ncbi:nucleotidyltransferase family protein [Spirosoma validum]|uniref:Nucleotidyltransferase family protein n=1 Tax=Spirosoma validum TaxID=2771355 RepID=A0A927GFZ6_9BACT|nr:nucleotidyltransferase family protein [Spirosoma validum]MBD2756472.1 nucleotidyltransferase family protein [Spirosoma validum]